VTAEVFTMLARLARPILALLLLLPLSQAFADQYSDTIKVFRNAGESAKFFGNAYGYAVFPTIGKGGFVVGAAHGNGRVYRQGKYVGDTSMTQLSVGAQLGGQAYSEMIFFQNKSALDDFTSGNFEFAAEASAVAITAGASASGGSTGTSAGASGTQEHAVTAGRYFKGMAIFTVAKGGLMYEASIGGQKFSYKAKK
jgi:lipid-binding SYLF domain-containing protein